MSRDTQIISAIDQSPLNRGLSGAAWLASKDNIPFVIGENIVLFEGAGDGSFEVHFLFKEKGRSAVDAARECFRQMFRYRGAETIFGLVPSDMRHAKIMARWVGGKFVGQRETSEGPCDLFVLSKEMWSEATCRF